MPLVGRSVVSHNHPLPSVHTVCSIIPPKSPLNNSTCIRKLAALQAWLSVDDLKEGNCDQLLFIWGLDRLWCWGILSIVIWIGWCRWWYYNLVMADVGIIVIVYFLIISMIILTTEQWLSLMLAWVRWWSAVLLSWNRMNSLSESSEMLRLHTYQRSSIVLMVIVCWLYKMCDVWYDREKERVTMCGRWCNNISRTFHLIAGECVFVQPLEATLLLITEPCGVGLQSMDGTHTVCGWVCGWVYALHDMICLFVASQARGWWMFCWPRWLLIYIPVCAVV